MEISGRKALVLGAGKSGIASARFLAERGATVALHDKKPVESWPQAALQLKAEHKIGLIGGDLPSWLLDQIDLVVISPGVPKTTLPARYVDRKDGEVIGEVELAYRFLKGKIVGITGSNGKTTTTALIGEILKASGLPTQVGGNIGTPLLDLVESSRDDGWTVAELSSFQLETIVDFRCDVALCLNVTPNHLDRYDSFLDYAAAKHRIFLNQRTDDTAILNADNAITNEWPSGLKANVIKFSVERELVNGVFLRDRDLVSTIGDKESVLTTRAAFAAALTCGVDAKTIRRAVADFKGVEHRIEFVEEIDGVRFYNDSKATSVDATSKALSALGEDTGKTILILGGRGKNAPYAPLIPLIHQCVSRVIVLGEDADNIVSQLAGEVELERAASLEDAVSTGFAAAQKGDSVLLAPACASFDMFKSFEERGQKFKQAVRSLEEQRKAEG